MKFWALISSVVIGGVAILSFRWGMTLGMEAEFAEKIHNSKRRMSGYIQDVGKWVTCHEKT